MTNDWRRLAEAVARRRVELGRITQAELAHRADLSVDRIQAIEGAKKDRYRKTTLLALETALDWEPGSVTAVLAGRDPVPKGRQVPSNAELGEDLLRQIDELQAVIDRRLGQRNSQVRKVLFDGIRADVEESTNDGANRQ